MATEFVPAVDFDGDELWLDADDDIAWLPVGAEAQEGWRRLGWMQPVETPEPTRRCGCWFHWSLWGDSGSTRLADPCRRVATSIRESDSVQVCEQCLTCRPEES